MKLFKQLFHFLGGVHLAIALIAITAFIVIIGTLIESRTGSHRLAAHWTYENNFFIFILGLLFINILFSALRRWPFKKKHIPFLITHLGLLMIISGTFIKHRLGLQGQLTVWEGSGNQQVLIAHTYALTVQKKERSDQELKNDTFLITSFHPQTYHLPNFPELRFKLIGYAAHVKNSLDTWIKESKAYIAGFPLMDVHAWDSSQSFPLSSSYPYSATKKDWSILAVRSNEVQEAIKKAYIQDVMLHLKIKKSDESFSISLEKALEVPFEINSGICTVEIEFSYPFLEPPALIFNWKSLEGTSQEFFTLPLRGNQALIAQLDASQWTSPSFIIDLKRFQPALFLLDDEQSNTLFFAFDKHGRIEGKTFNAASLQNFIAYEQGFKGYGIQAVFPFPSFPTHREAKEKAHLHFLTAELKKLFLETPSLSPPLTLFKAACSKSNLNFSEVLMEFLTEWEKNSDFLFSSNQPLSASMNLMLASLEIPSISLIDQQTIQWTIYLLGKIQKSSEQPLITLKDQKWPFLPEFIQAIQNEPFASPSNLLAGQIHSYIHYLPSAPFHEPFDQIDRLKLLSAYFKIYGMDYRSLTAFQNLPDEQFEELENYWNIKDNDQKISSKNRVFETSLTNRVTPIPTPSKIEDQQPGIVLEIEQGEQKQSIALAYDASGNGMKWPILEGNYLVHFKPQFVEIPHRIRLRQAREIKHPQSSQVYSYESEVWVTEKEKATKAYTLSMNHVYETWKGYRFYLAGIGTSTESGIKRIQLAVNHDPAKYILTYPGCLLVLIGMILLFWIYPNQRKLSK